ncbi:MAG: hypothetical protein NT023_00520 [Armatimonadetes bacterium]|nr:hypothetical protein [Armatimonadota bacterium]
MTGGYNSLTPRPIPQKRKDAGWIWALVGCGGLVVIVVIALTIAFTSSKKGGVGKLFNSIIEASTEGEQLISVRDSLKKYRVDHKGAYPKSLSELVPNYLSQEYSDYLAEHKAVYLPPAPNAPPDFAVITISSGSSEVLGQKQFYYAKVLKSDEVVMDQVTRTNLETKRSRSSTPSEEDNF